MKRKLTSPKKSNSSKKTKPTNRNPKTQLDNSPVDRKETVTGIITKELPWKNLELILSLQSNELDVKEKVELAFSFVKGYGGEKGTDEDEERQAVEISRLIIFLSDWIQSLLISSEKNLQVKGDLDSELCLDFRCWEIFKFCLKQSSILHVSINLARNLLKAIGYITEFFISALDTSLSSEVDFCNGGGFEVYGSVVDCLSLLFSLENGMSNDNLDLWFSTVEPVLKLTRKVLTENIKDSHADRYVLQFSCLVLEPFSKFLMTHPTKKNGFRDFLDKLFEPFLYVLGLLNRSEDKKDDLEITMLKLIQEILSLALFHSAHIDGFLGLGGSERYLPESQENKTILKSYHRHFFSKFENMLLTKKELELSCMGSLFRLFINRVMKQQRDSNQLHEGTATVASTAGQAEERPWKLQNTASNENESSAKSHFSSSLRLETRKSLFDFFLHLMEPILLEIDGYRAGSQMAPRLIDIYCVIKSANSLLFHFAHKQIYLKTEDASGGACFYFFKKIFKIIVLVASQLQNCDTYYNGSEMHVLLAKELVTAIGYLLQIEYEVFEKDLVTLWLIILFLMEFSNFSSENAEDDCPLTSLLLGLGCQLISLYSDLRQVSVAIFALCKAVRLVIPTDDNKKTSDTEELQRVVKLIRIVFPLEQSAKSVEKLLSSQDLRLAIHRATKEIPEGQSSGCIKSLAKDVSRTMKWIKQVCCSTNAREQDGQVAALLTGPVSEVYSLILDSVGITTGNSKLVDQGMKDLVDCICPCLTYLVSADSDCIENFFSVLTGKHLDIVMAEKNRETYRKSVRFFIIFFLRVYMSSRSLYRQVISLMPPKKAEDMAGIKGDSVAARCGSDWIKEKNWNYEGYFSWISQPSASIVDIIKHISTIYLKDDSADCSVLVYILYGVILQRLVDLNRDIKSLDYVSQISDNQIQGVMLKHVSVLKREGEDLTDILLSDDIISGFADVKTFETIQDTDQWVLRVSGINRKCLPAVRLWVLSQHIDIWCPHAGKKKLKNFLSQLIGSSVRCILKGGDMSTLGWENNVDKGTQNRKIGLEQFSLGLLCDSVLYEHEFVRRYLASSFYRVLKMTAETYFKDFTEEVNFDSLPDCSEVLILLESSIANSSGKLQSESFLKADVSQLDNRKFTACQNLLNLLCGMPKEYMNKKSFQLYASYVLDLERFILFIMLRCLNKLSPGDMQNLFSLFITCRKTLKSIAMISCDKLLGATKLPLSDSLLLASWLLKSTQAAITFQERFGKDFTRKSMSALFSLIDHTSYMFLTVSKNKLSKGLPLLDEQLMSSELFEERGQANFEFESLVEQGETLLIALRATFRDEKNVFECKTLILNELAPLFSSFSGWLWGLASAVTQGDMQKDHQNKKRRWKSEQFSKLLHIIHVLSNFFEVFIHCLFLSGDVQREIQANINWTRLLDGTEGSNGLASGDIVETSDVKLKFIMTLIKGDSVEVVLALRHLLIASAAILRLNLQIDGITFSPTFVSILMGISNDLLSVFADLSEAPHELSFIWLDGAVKVLEELGNQFCLSNPILNRDLYSKFIELHLKVIGKCISLQGKEATLESHEIGFAVNTFHAKQLLSEKNRSHKLHWLDELKERIRMSFKVFIHSSTELHLLSGVQAIERALVGVWEVCPAIYYIQTGNRDGGRISETAAAGLDCLDLILEHATGRKRLNVVKRHIQGLLSAVFGIVAHMQSPSIFFTNAVAGSQGSNSPDAGSVILMCVEVLIRIAGKHALFQMDSSHISQSIHIPGIIFHDYLQTTRVGFSVLDRTLLYKDGQQQDLLGSSKDRQVDQQFSICLYAACCRLLYTAVKHHKSETEGSISTLQESVSALLHCLETAGNKLGSRASWEVEEGIRCASFLRRIYEELRQQKDVFGQHCFKFLSTYIWVSSGYGPLKTGIKREVDEALRPGVYALIDSCSPNDLQYLHTVFGEGPCRNTLATLQQDYKLNFKYQGKV